MKEFIAVTTESNDQNPDHLCTGLVLCSFTLPLAACLFTIIINLASGLIISFIKQNKVYIFISNIFFLISTYIGFNTFSGVIRESLLLMEDRAGPRLYNNL